MSNIAIRFLQPRNVGQPESLEAIVAVLLTQKFRIYHIYTASLLDELGKWQPIFDDIRAELALAYERRRLSFAIADTERPDHLQMRFELGWEQDANGQTIKQHFYGSVYRSSGVLFTRHEFDPEYYARRLLELGKALYGVLNPTFGWIERCRTRGYTKETDIASLAVPHIYWANFFSPAYVERLGKDFLLNAPVGETEQLEDGGILYTLTSKLSPNRLPKGVEVAVKDYFGVASVRCKTG